MAIDSLNPNSWAGAAEYINSLAADMVVFQDANVVEKGRVDAEVASRDRGWKTTIAPCTITDLGWRSVGVAVAV